MLLPKSGSRDGAADTSAPPADSPDTAGPSSASQHSASRLDHAAASDSSLSATDVVSSTSSSSSFFSSLISSNPYFSAGFGLMLFGGALAFARRGMMLASSTAQKRMLVSLEIPSRDKSHPWFLHWMGKQAEAQAMRQAGLLGPQRKESLREFLGLSAVVSAEGGGSAEAGSSRSVKGKGKSTSASQYRDPLVLASGQSVSPVRIFSHDLAVETTYAQQDQADSASGNHINFGGHIQRIGVASSANTSNRGTANFSLVPGPGTHWLRYRGVWMRLKRERAERMVDITTGAPWETVTLTTLYAYRHLLTQLLSEARQLSLAATEGKTLIFTAWNTDWQPFGKPRRARNLGSVVLSGHTKERLVDDIQAFLRRGKWYAERGIPYRRGYLLHGSPGSGKSSFIMALAGSLDFNICLLNLSERGLTDDKLNHLLSNAPERSILLLEDVDAAFSGRQTTSEDGYQSNVTFSGLLNALDGVASGESRIIFMTTNHVERLDPALIRPGRVDLISELGDAEFEQVVELTRRFYGGRRAVTSAVESLKGGQEASDEVVALLEEQAARGGGSAASREGEEEVRLEEAARAMADAVQGEAARRRAALGLDPSGRRMVAKAEEGHAGTRTGSASAVRASTAHRPGPAAGGGVSMAELQGLFIRFPDDPVAAREAFLTENEMRAQMDIDGPPGRRQ